MKKIQMTLKEEYEANVKKFKEEANQVLRYTRLNPDWGLYSGGYNEPKNFRRDVWYETMYEYVNENIEEINKRTSQKILDMIGE